MPSFHPPVFIPAPVSLSSGNPVPLTSPAVLHQGSGTVSWIPSISAASRQAATILKMPPWLFNTGPSSVFGLDKPLLMTAPHGELVLVHFGQIQSRKSMIRGLKLCIGGLIYVFLEKPGSATGNFETNYFTRRLFIFILSKRFTQQMRFQTHSTHVNT